MVSHNPQSERTVSAPKNKGEDKKTRPAGWQTGHPNSHDYAQIEHSVKNRLNGYCPYAHKGCVRAGIQVGCESCVN